MMSKAWGIAVAVVALGCGKSKDAYEDYQQRGRSTEALIHLDKIGTWATQMFVTESRFPATEAPLTPATACCAQNAGGKRRCAATPSDWAAPAWRELDFAPDRDHDFQYAYKPDPGGQGFHAYAVGDLDCDGTFVTYELRGEVKSGTPVIQVTEPPAGAD